MPPTIEPLDHEGLRAALLGLISEVMRCDAMDPATISDDTPCVGGGLLQDSLDVLEFIVAIDRVYGVSLRDGESGRAVLASMGAMTRYVSQHRVR